MVKALITRSDQNPISRTQEDEALTLLGTVEVKNKKRKKIGGAAIRDSSPTGPASSGQSMEIDSDAQSDASVTAEDDSSVIFQGIENAL